MKNNRGQALIEFVIILPVMIMLCFSFIDLGRIVLENNRLESLTSVVITKYEETENYDDVFNYLNELGYKNINLSISTSSNTLTIKLSEEIDIITPGLSSVVDNNISVERTINYE